jgi:hypothetical protein
MKRRFPLLLLVIAFACNKNDEHVATVGEYYLEEVLEVMENISINRKTIDWPVFKDNARLRAQGAASISDVLPAIKFALNALGDHHSFYVNGSIVMSAFDLTCIASSGTVVNPIENVGYVKVTAFSGIGTEADSFAQGLQNTIKGQDKAGLKGWIVDLRGNSGGNMWPMIAGVGPVLGEGIVGYFIDPDNAESPWDYTNGRSRNSGTDLSVVQTPYKTIDTGPKVAVLIDQLTASSGEATAIAFVGRPNTKLFGVSTCGVSTANSGHLLSDGAWLYLTISVMADRNKGKKGGSIVPDVTVAGDEVVGKAVEWLNQ